jgi:hypothetical protein
MSTETSLTAISQRSAVEDIPIAEFDPDRNAVIEPGLVVTPSDIPRAAVMCFFNAVVERIAARPEARKVGALHAAHGKHTIWEITIRGERLAVFHPVVGSPMAAMFMEAAIGLVVAPFSHAEVRVLCNPISPWDRWSSPIRHCGMKARAFITLRRTASSMPIGEK